MSGKHDRSVDDERSAKLLLTGPIVIRGVGRSVKDALHPGRPSRHRAFASDADDVVAPTAARATSGAGAAVDWSSPTSAPEPPTTQEDAAVDAASPQDAVLPQTGTPDGPREDRVDERPNDAARSDDASQSPSDQAESGDGPTSPTAAASNAAAHDAADDVTSVEGAPVASVEQDEDPPEVADEHDGVDGSQASVVRSSSSRTDDGRSGDEHDEGVADLHDAEPRSEDLKLDDTRADAVRGVEASAVGPSDDESDVEGGRTEVPVPAGSTPMVRAAPPEAPDQVDAVLLGDRGWTTAEELYARPRAVPPTAAEEAAVDAEAVDHSEAVDVPSDSDAVPDGETPADESAPSGLEQEGGPVLADEHGHGHGTEAEQTAVRSDDAEVADDHRSATDAFLARFAGAAPSTSTDDDVTASEDGRADAVGTSAVPEPRTPARSASSGPGRDVPRSRTPDRERDGFGRRVAGLAVLIVFAIVCGGLVTAVLLRTQREAAAAASEAAIYTPSPPVGRQGVATGPAVVVIGDGTTSSAAKGVTAAQRWSALLGSFLDGTVRTISSAGMGYTADGASGETFVEAAAKVPSNADVVIVFGGAADSDVQPLSLAKAATDTFSTVQQQAPDAKVVVVGPAIRAGVEEADLTSIRATLRSAAAIAEAAWVDPIGSGWLSDAKQSASSPSSLTAADERTLAAKMRSAVKRALE